MCGRYELHAHPAAIALAFGLAELPHVVPRYNIAPMTDVPVVRIGASGQRECHMLRWGLVPRSAKDASVGARMVNARGETLRERPAFRLPFRWHRCVLPANGFYEWTDGASPSVRRQPLHISLPDHALFALAGLYERWLDADGRCSTPARSSRHRPMPPLRASAIACR